MTKLSILTFTLFGSQKEKRQKGTEKSIWWNNGWKQFHFYNLQHKFKCDYHFISDFMYYCFMFHLFQTIFFWSFSMSGFLSLHACAYMHEWWEGGDLNVVSVPPPHTSVPLSSIELQWCDCCRLCILMIFAYGPNTSNLALPVKKRGLCSEIFACSLPAFWCWHDDLIFLNFFLLHEMEQLHL